MEGGKWTWVNNIVSSSAGSETLGWILFCFVCEKSALQKIQILNLLIYCYFIFDSLVAKTSDL